MPVRGICCLPLVPEPGSVKLRGVALLSASNINVRFNDRVILDDLSLTIDEGDKIGMVGRNGSGKSTLLKIIAGLQLADSGEITQRRDLQIGYLPQDFALDPALNVLENIRAGTGYITRLIAEFEALPPASHRHHELEHQIQAHDGWNLENRIAIAMAKLSCPPAERSVQSLSGGEKRRIALCRALVSEPDLLILDEPTNHLDTESIEWLAEYLENYRGTFLLVTHDRYFLDRVTRSIAEVSNGKAFRYEGNYTDYLITKAERDAASEVTEHKRQMFLRRELEWVRRGPKARTTKSKARLDRYFEVAGQEAVEIDRDVDLVIPPPPPLPNRIVDLHNVGMELGGKWLFSHLTLSFAAGQRLGVFGKNGLGKTTLMKIIMGQLEPSEGTVKIGQLIRFNYIDQGRVQLNDDRTVLEELSDGSEFVVFGEERLSVRAYLKRFLFTDDRITTQVRFLSGGERSRLLLARILKNGGNFLVLDEPTNDLDLATLRVLEEALAGFAGVVLVVSHDRYFLNRVCTGILAFEGNGHVAYSEGNYDYYLEKRQRLAPIAKLPPAALLPPSKEPKAAAPSVRPKKLSFKDARELEGMESAISIVEGRIAEIGALFVDPDFNRKYGQQMAGLMAELESEKAKLNALFARWEELEALRAACSNAAEL